jgi:hypothetical protein
MYSLSFFAILTFCMRALNVLNLKRLSDFEYAEILGFINQFVSLIL